MKSGDTVRVLPSEYQRAGQIGRVVAEHGILTGYVWVQFTPRRQELIGKKDLELISGRNHG